VSFAAVAALAVGLLALAPLIAHLLQRGRTLEREFPAAALVPATPSVSRERRRLEDRGLLAIRVAMVLALAILGATPLVRCDRLALGRTAGGSVAFAVVLDDSMSMRARMPGGRIRWKAALDGAAALLSSAREGDAVALVLAGRPARVALAATTDLSSAREALERLAPSDRSTDLSTAVQLARAAVGSLPHEDKRVIVLSDLAGDPLAQGAPPVWTPLPELAAPVENCGIVRAVGDGRRARVTIACQPGSAAGDRAIEIVVAPSARERSGDVLGRVEVSALAGERTFVVDHDATDLDRLARLTGEDALREDDEAPVMPRAEGLVVAVVADRALAGALTGGSTVIEQALAALEPGPRVRPLPVVPRDTGELEGVAALLIDDPPGLSPETRSALSDWVERGGVALALLGPRASSTQLASTLEPFARGAVHWEASTGAGVRPGSAPWLGEEAGSLGELTRLGRARMDAALPDGAQVTALWDDGAPFLIERSLGRGVLLSIALPASVDQSDLALRPAFIALLDHVLGLARRRSSATEIVVGTPWVFDASERVVVEGPAGSVEVLASRDATTRVATPTVSGRYRVVVDGHSHARYAVVAAEEIFALPAAAPAGAEASPGGGAQGRVDVSREVALLLLLLLAGELVLRAARRRGRYATAPAPASARGA
jgi:hypothetical protein